MRSTSICQSLTLASVSFLINAITPQLHSSLTHKLVSLWEQRRSVDKFCLMLILTSVLTEESTPPLAKYRQGDSVRTGAASIPEDWIFSAAFFLRPISISSDQGQQQFPFLVSLTLSVSAAHPLRLRQKAGRPFGFQESTDFTGGVRSGLQLSSSVPFSSRLLLYWIKLDLWTLPLVGLVMHGVVKKLSQFCSFI